MSTPLSRRLLLPGLTLVGAIAVGVLIATAFDNDSSGNTVIIEGAPMGYGSIEELLKETDVTLAATAISAPRDFIDFGGDGKPDFDGDLGMPTQLVAVRIDEVLRGDPSLAGTVISVAQLSPLVQGSDVSLETDRISKGQQVVLVGRLDPANPGVGDTGETLLIPAGSGFGVFDLQADGSITARVDGVLGDSRFIAGKAIDPAVLAGSS